MHGRNAFLGALCAVLPDADVLMHFFVPYEHAFGHRGAWHSLTFCSLLAAVIGFASRDNRRTRASIAFVSSASHALLDMLTDGGLGVALFWPLSTERLFFWWRPIPVSPIGVRSFFSMRGLRILQAESAVMLSAAALAVIVLSRRVSAPDRERKARARKLSEELDVKTFGELPVCSHAIVERERVVVRVFAGRHGEARRGPPWRVCRIYCVTDELLCTPLVDDAPYRPVIR